ncbi:hypothetical protein PHSC3_001389 [Chlamydiales bacterium STE3]|nr:hypothetical protein PHSC3_001389 [Chlamydiales bacterium STE3]
MGYQTLKIKSHYQVEILDTLETVSLPEELEERIERIWRAELIGRDLFNGYLLSAVAYDKERLTGVFVPYKLFIAQLRDPSLKPILKIIPVSISGLTILGNNVLFAKRSSYVTQFRYHYELAPSGSIDNFFLEGSQINLREQLKKELREEIGVDSKRVKSVKFFALIYDKELESIDLCAEIRINPYAMQSHSWEYSQVITVPKDELAHFVKIDGEHFVPLSLSILRQRKLL